MASPPGPTLCSPASGGAGGAAERRAATEDRGGRSRRSRRARDESAPARPALARATRRGAVFRARPRSPRLLPECAAAETRAPAAVVATCAQHGPPRGGTPSAAEANSFGSCSRGTRGSESIRRNRGSAAKLQSPLFLTRTKSRSGSGSYASISIESTDISASPVLFSANTSSWLVNNLGGGIESSKPLEDSRSTWPQPE